MGGGLMAAYLTHTEADALAATLPGLASYLALATTAAKDAVLLQASEEIDDAMPYQGRKYALGQEREFPRVGYESAGVRGQEAGVSDATLIPSTIWDWDEAEAEAVVPARVKLAVLRQADYLASGRREAMVQRQESGLASQSVGGMSESYKDVADAGGGTEAMGLLCVEARSAMARYRLRSGPML
jgi:hypothetical protein